MRIPRDCPIYAIIMKAAVYKVRLFWFCLLTDLKALMQAMEGNDQTSMPVLRVL